MGFGFRARRDRSGRGKARRRFALVHILELRSEGRNRFLGESVQITVLRSEWANEQVMSHQVHSGWEEP